MLEHSDLWDPLTAGVVLSRAGASEPPASFTDTEFAAAAALVDRLLAQSDDRRIPVVQMIDARLRIGETDGWHYDDLPPDADAWRKTLALLDSDAQQQFGGPLAELDAVDQKDVIQNIGSLATAGEQWHDIARHCIYRGFCLQGCKEREGQPVDHPHPGCHGTRAEIRPDAHVSRVLPDEQSGRVTGVEYISRGRHRRQGAAAVAVAGYSIETPRLLLSASGRHPQGLGNDSDQLGRLVMVQGAPQTAARFDEEIRTYKAPPPEVTSERFYETDPAKPYRRGWSIQTVSPLPITWAEHVIAQRHWGEVLREYMRDYVHWSTLGALCEFLPLASNRVTRADETDRHGLPVAHFSYSMGANDHELMRAATASMESILTSAGGTDLMTIDRDAHLVGGCRMAALAEDGCVDADHRVFGVPNLFVVDGCLLPTQGRRTRR